MPEPRRRRPRGARREAAGAAGRSLLWHSRDPEVGRALAAACPAVGLKAVALGEREAIAGRAAALDADLVVVDCVPDMSSALAACRRVQRRRGEDWRPVLAVLPEEAEESVVMAAANCFDDLLRRPLGHSELVGRLILARRARDARARLRLLAEAVAVSPTAVAVVDALHPALPVTVCNAAFELLTGYRGSEVPSLDQLESRDERSPSLLETAVRATAAWIAHRQVEMDVRRRDGVITRAGLGLAPVTDATGRVTHVVLTQTATHAAEPTSSDPTHA